MDGNQVPSSNLIKRNYKWTATQPSPKHSHCPTDQTFEEVDFPLNGNNSGLIRIHGISVFG